MKMLKTPEEVQLIPSLQIHFVKKQLFMQVIRRSADHSAPLDSAQYRLPNTQRSLQNYKQIHFKNKKIKRKPSNLNFRRNCYKSGKQYLSLLCLF